MPRTQVDHSARLRMSTHVHVFCRSMVTGSTSSRLTWCNVRRYSASHEYINAPSSSIRLGTKSSFQNTTVLSLFLTSNIMARTRKSTTKKAPAKSGVAKRKAAPKPTHATRGRPKGKGASSSKTPTHTLTPATNTAAPDFIVRGTNDSALFTLTCYRGEGMCLLAMNWKSSTPPTTFVGFAIE